MYSLVYNIKIDQQIFKQEILINNSIAIVSLNNKKSVFIEDNDRTYLIDFEKLNLVLLDFSRFQTQNEMISKKIGSINITKGNQQDNIFGFTALLHNYTNNDNSFNCTVKTICVPDIALSSYNSYFNFNMRNQVIKISLDRNELVAYNRTEMNFNGVKQIVETELISIEENEIPKETLKILEYKIIENERNLH
jgi:hypothetical protein